MTERRYDDDEVAEILARATEEEGDPAAGPPGKPSGLTLEDLKAIGVEVGISPQQIAEAARALERRGATPAPRTLAGIPRSVARIVPLDRPLEDREWERLVGDLRQTFGAVGKVTSHGSLRTWRNGNLQVHVEPDGPGWRLRMQTLKGDASTLAGVGGVFAAVGFLVLVLSMLGGIDDGNFMVGIFLLLGGLTQLGYLRLSLPRWADERGSQMEAIAARLPGLLGP